MLKKRIIPCLDIQNGRTVKGVNFTRIQDAGDPVELAERYVQEGADELVFLDIMATIENRSTFIYLVKKLANVINIPFTVGGGISSIQDASQVINAGADKISINSAAVKNPMLISNLAKEFGSQCVVLATDTDYMNNQWKVFIEGGKKETPLYTVAWIEQAVSLGAGEVLLTSMRHDGTKKGFAVHLINQVSDAVNVPIIASGGAGYQGDFCDLFQQSNASAGLAASIFHYGEVSIPELKYYLKKRNIPVRCL